MSAPSGVSQQMEEDIRVLGKYMGTLGAPRRMTRKEILQHNEYTNVLITHYQHLQAFLDNTRDNIAIPLVGVAHDVRTLLATYKAVFPLTFRINDLPEHILAVILDLSITGSDDPDVSHAELTKKARLVASTCHLWRAVTIDDPKRWSHITFNDGPLFARSLLYLERALDAPKTIRILSNPETPITLSDIQFIAPRIMSRISTIRTLLLDVPDSKPLFELWNLISCVTTPSTPLILERLDLIHRIDPNDRAHLYMINPVVPLFGGRPIPTLVHLSLTSFPLDWTSSTGALTNLVRLELIRTPQNARPPLPIFVAALKALPNLTNLALNQPPCDLSAPYSDPAITLRRVVTLSLSDLQYSECRRLLDIIRTPHVYSLKLCKLRGVRRDADHHFFSTLVATWPLEKLKFLALEDMNDFSIPRVNHGYFKFISRLQTLKVLRLGPGVVSCEAFYPLLLDAVTEADIKVGAPQANVPAPNLSVLILAGLVDTDYFAQWLRTRRGIGHGITKMLLEEAVAEEYSDCRRRLQRALKEGEGPRAVFVFGALTSGTAAIEKRYDTPVHVG